MAIKQGKAGKKSKAVAKKLTKKAKQVEDDVEMESETDDSSEEETVIKSKPNGPKAAKTSQDSSEEDSEEDSEEESEEEPPKKGASKKASQKKVTKQKVEEEDEDDEDDSEEEQQPKGKAPLAQMEDDDEEEEEEDDEESEEEVTPKKSKAKTAKAKKQESDEEDSEEESEEEEMDDEPMKKGKNGKVQQAEEESEEEESDEGESEEEEEEKTSKKRKAKAIKTQAKKQKTEDIITIKVSNIPELVTDEKLVKFFTKKGVETTDFRRNVKRGFGFLDLADPDSLETALALSGEKLKGSELTIEKAEPKRPSEKTSPSKESTGGKKYNEDTDKVTLFMKNLPFQVEVDEIKAVFPDAVDVRLAKKGDGSLRGFGFIEFSTEAEADEAMEANQGTEIGGRAIMLDFMGSKARNKPKAADRGSDKPRARGEAGKTKVLFVGNLSFDTTVEGLKEAFEGCSDARIIYRDDGSSKGIGFVEYNSPDDAKAALDTMSGTELDGRQMHLDYASERGSGGGGGGRGGFRGGRGGGFRGGRDGGRGGFGDRRGGFGDRRGSFRGGRGGTPRRDGVQNFQGKRKTFDD